MEIYEDPKVDLDTADLIVRVARKRPEPMDPPHVGAAMLRGEAAHGSTADGNDDAETKEAKEAAVKRIVANLDIEEERRRLLPTLGGLEKLEEVEKHLTESLPPVDAEHSVSRMMTPLDEEAERLLLPISDDSDSDSSSSGRSRRRRRRKRGSSRSSRSSSASSPSSPSSSSDSESSDSRSTSSRVSHKRRRHRDRETPRRRSHSGSESDVLCLPPTKTNKDHARTTTTT